MSDLIVNNYDSLRDKNNNFLLNVDNFWWINLIFITLILIQKIYNLIKN
jgi:hypothetical protein